VIRNYVAFLYEGRNDPRYQEIYLNEMGEMVPRLLVEGGIPEWGPLDILRRFGKYLRGQTEAWNTSFALSGWKLQEDMVFHHINLWCKKNKWRLKETDLFYTCVEVKNFDFTRDYGAVYQTDVESSVQMLKIDEIRNASREDVLAVLPEAKDEDLDALFADIDDYEPSQTHEPSDGTEEEADIGGGLLLEEEEEETQTPSIPEM
jgi:hypothetical protein